MSQVIAVFCGPCNEGEVVTPDGISDEDWGRVHELALEVVNATGRDEPEENARASTALREALDDLQERYGPLPSILATRADYAEDDADREYWLLAAYSQAVGRGDLKNLVLISESLASFYVEHKDDVDAGTRWVETLEGHLAQRHEDFESEQAIHLRARLEQRASGQGGEAKERQPVPESDALE